MQPFNERRRLRLISVTCVLIITGPIILMIIIFFLFGLFSKGLPSQLGEQVATGKPLHSENAERQKIIEDTFDFAWNGYHTYAFPHDELKPATNEPGHSRNDWGATAVDALTTAIMMEKGDVVQIILEHVAKTDFSHTQYSISVFETTIRYLGGMISAHDLLTGPFNHLIANASLVDELLEQSGRLGNMLSRAFLKGHVLPHPKLMPNAVGVEDAANSLAGSGTLILEWTALSDRINDAKFEQLSRQAEQPLLNPMPKESEPLPGLVGTKLRVSDGMFTDRKGGWGGSGDSFYEYLLKMYFYDPSQFAQYRDRWVLAAESTISHLASKPEGLPDTLLFLGKFANIRKIPESGHMECFAGGNFLLAGQILQEKRYTDFALKLIEGCRYTYTSAATGLGPEAFKWRPMECDDRETSWLCDAHPAGDADIAFHEEHNFWITEPSYNLRPEVIESYYYAYRMTQDKKYQDWAWDAFLAINASTRMEHGFNYLRDVRQLDSEMGNNQESYFFSETLKYLWLIFDEKSEKGGNDEWHVNAGFKGEDKWVYNTEGHPIKIRERPAMGR